MASSSNVSSASSSSSSSSCSPSSAVSSPVRWIFWERQQAALCASHAINSLLQSSYFTAVDLSSIAQQLDETERSLMAASGTDTSDYLAYMAADSSNVDESGNFSIEVIKKALEAFDLTCLSITSSEAGASLQDPIKETGFICHLQSHWLSLRKIHGEWFNLNSLLEHGPEWISEFYLAVLLQELKRQGYSIFVVRGRFPNLQSCQFEEKAPLRETGGEGEWFCLEDVVRRRGKPPPGVADKTKDEMKRAQKPQLTDEQALAVAIAASLDSGGGTKQIAKMDDDELQRAIEASRRTASLPSSSFAARPSKSGVVSLLDDDDEEAQLAAAIALSKSI